MTAVALYSREERKSNGVFYTPNFLAQYLAKKVIYYWGRNKAISLVLDPSCGDSVLLRSFAEELLLSGKKKTFPKILGIDKDINAIKSSNNKFANKQFKDFVTRFINTDGLFPMHGKNTKNDWAALKLGTLFHHGVDISLSNPPWGADLSTYEPRILNHNFSLAKGQFDSYDLFVEATLNILNDNGIYGLILPDSIFSQEHSRLRQLLANNTTIYLIARLGEKIFSEINRACVIVIGRKAKAPIHHTVDSFRLSSGFKKRVLSNELGLEQVEKDLAHKVPQSRFIENDNCVFDIDLKIEEQKTYKKLQTSNQLLKDIVSSTRGAEISKKGVVCQCPKCNYWMPYPRAKQPICSYCSTRINLNSVVIDNIVINHNGTGNYKLKVGEDLFRYTSLSKSWITTLKNGINYKDLKIYQGEKILVRKTGVGITASIDYENAITNQVVYILKLKSAFIKHLSLEFVLAILNSRAMTYFLIKKHGENEWKSHPYLTQTMLENLPFPDIDVILKEHKSLINKVTRIVKSEVATSIEKNITKTNDLIIERIVARVFNLNKLDYRTIFETLRSSEQLIPIKRLLNCTYNEIFRVNGI